MQENENNNINAEDKNSEDTNNEKINLEDKNTDNEEKTNLENKSADNIELEEKADQNNDLENNLEKEIEILKEEKLRLLAEMENLRKRSEKDKIDSIKYGNTNLARDLLSPYDNLVRAQEAIHEKEELTKMESNILVGLTMVKKELMAAFEKHGVKKIEIGENEKFDPNLHQAVLEIEDNEKDEGIIVQVNQDGFTIFDRLLRPTMVGVSKKPKKEENSQN